MHTITRSLCLFLYIGFLQHSCASDGKKPARLVCRLQHPDGVSSVVFWPKKEILVTGCWDGSIRFWDFRTGKASNEWKAHKQGVIALALAREGMLASGGCDHAVHVWNGLTGNKVKEFKTDAPTISLTFSADGTFLSCTTWERCYLWDLSQERLILKRELTVAPAVKFSPRGKVLAIARERGIVMVFDDACGGLTTNPLLLDKSERDEFGRISNESLIWSLAFSSDGRTLAAFGEKSDLILWEVLTGKERRRLKTGRAIGFSVAFVPNRDFLATGEGWCFDLRGFPSEFTTTGTTSKPDSDCTRLWDIRTGKALCRLEGHEKGTRCLAFSPDGKFLATGSEDKSALVWDVSELMKESSPDYPQVPLGDLESHWKNLTHDDAVSAFDSILALSASPKESVPFLRSKLRPVSAVEKARAEKLLKDLDNDDFSTREHASEQLLKLGESAERVLWDRLSKPTSSEARHRIEAVIDKIDKCKGHNPPPEILGALRGIETLERIGSDDAVAVLESLAKGIPSARQTEEARASLDSINERRK